MATIFCSICADAMELAYDPSRDTVSEKGRKHMRVGLLTQFYDPEPGPAALPGVLARGLVARGHEVQVLTGFPHYPAGVIALGYRLQRVLDEVLDGVNVQ